MPQPPSTVQVDPEDGECEIDSIDFSEDEAPMEVASADTDDLDKIIALQTFEGWWKLDDRLLEILELSRIEAEKNIPGNVSLEVWATILAIYFLEGKLLDRKDAWELVVEKARGWLDGQGASGEVSVELFDVAGGLLNVR